VNARVGAAGEFDLRFFADDAFFNQAFSYLALDGPAARLRLGARKVGADIRQLKGGLQMLTPAPA